MRKREAHLIDWLFQLPHDRQGNRFVSSVDLFELYRRLELGNLPDLESNEQSRFIRVIYSGSVRKSFPNRQIDLLTRFSEKNSSGRSLSVSCFLIGLHGHTGALPQSDWDQVASPQLPESTKAFFEIFEDRLIRLYCDSWRRNRVDISREYERAKRRRLRLSKPTATQVVIPTVDWGREILLNLIGLGLPSLREAQSLPDDLFVGLSAFLGRPIRTVSSLEGSLSVQFPGLGVRVYEFREGKNVLPREQCTRLGHSSLSTDQAGGGGQFNRLGSTAILGHIFREHQRRFEVRLGPLNPKQVAEFSPFERGNRFQDLMQFIKTFVGPSLDFDIRYEFDQNTLDQVGKATLGRFAESSSRSPDVQLGKTRLGFNSWLLSGPATESRSDACYRFSWGASGVKSELS